MQLNIDSKQLDQKKSQVRTTTMSSLKMPGGPQRMISDSLFPINNAAAALSALPLFGGVEDDSNTTTTTTETKKPENTTETKKSAATTTTIANAGGSAASPENMTPEQISSLLEQVQTLSSQTKELTGKLSGYEAKEQEAARAAMSREEALQADYEKAAQTIVQMDNALKRQAMINAINSFEDFKFHDTTFLLHEIDPSIMENMVVDLERGECTVTGIENELRRIAKEKSWLVKTAGKPNDSNGNGGRPPRGTGAPPAGGRGNQGNNQQRREELISRFSAISGRR